MIRIYHNPRCSKSRQTLELLRSNGIDPEIVLYQESLLNAETLKDLLQKMGINAAQLVRRSEQDFKDRNLGAKDVTESQLIDAMLACPKLIERPIVVAGERAVLGRPPENVLQLLADQE